MKQTKLFFVMMLMLVMSNAFTSCQKDVVVLQEIQEQETLDNPALVTKLKALGFTFDGDALVIDDKVQNTTSLDLSGAKLTSAEGLEVFPKLEKVNLSNNSLTNTFDFAWLPETVKSVNLAGNDLFQFKGLATVTDDGFTLQRELTELTLPASARFNVDLLPFYYNETKETVTLKMQNPTNNQIEPYTTLRNIPDENLRNYFKENFSSVMTGNEMDLGKIISEGERANAIWLINDVIIENFEGIQYILNRQEYEGSMVGIRPKNKSSITYLKPNKNLNLLGLTNIDTPNLDLSSAEQLRAIQLINNSSIEVVDLTHSKSLLKSTPELQMGAWTRHSIKMISCPRLTEIKISEDITTPALYDLALLDLPELKAFDMSKYRGISYLILGMLPKCKLTLPNVINIWEDENRPEITISITEDMWENTEVKSFIKKEYAEGHLTDLWGYLEHDTPATIKAFNYTTDL